MKGSVEPVSRGFRVRLDEPAFGVATGQAAVLYEQDVIVGAGRVASARTG
jgi:tRNA U34 2-thiouridine synthase MnmA/TrmU